jgi:hypothetical protein
MAPNLTEDEIDDLIFFARAGESKDLQETLSAIASREHTSTSQILLAAKEEGSKTTCLHMATGNGHLGMRGPTVLFLILSPLFLLLANLSIHEHRTVLVF